MNSMLSVLSGSKLANCVSTTPTIAQLKTGNGNTNILKNPSE